MNVEVPQGDLPRGATREVRHLLALRDVSAALQASDAWSVRSAAFAALSPVLSLVHLATESKVDLTLNNSVCVQKNKLLASLLDARLRSLVTLVKFWARRRRVYGKTHGRLSGFAFAQLAIFSVQVGHKEQSLSQMFHWFFDFYAKAFDWSSECVSVATGKRLAKASIRLRGSSHLSIEDAVERELDLCIPHLRPEENARLRSEIQRASDIWESTASLDAVLEPL